MRSGSRCRPRTARLPTPRRARRVLCALFPRLCANAADDRRCAGDCVEPRAASARRAASAKRPGADARRRSSTSASCPATRACTCSGTTPAGCCTSANRSRSAAVPAPTSRRRACLPPGRPGDRGRLPEHELRARGARAREPPDQAAPPARQHPPDAKGRAALLHPLPARHRVPDPRGGLRAGGRARGHDRAAARPAAARTSWSSSSTRCSRCATAAGGSCSASIPSAYGQMGRCLSPCLGDLDPNLYRRRLDEALRLFVDGADGREAPAGPRRGARCARRPTRQLLRARRVAAPADAPAAGDPRAARWRARGDPRPARGCVLAAHPVDQAETGRVLARRRPRSSTGVACRPRTPAVARRAARGGAQARRACRRARRARSPGPRSTSCGSSSTYLASHPDLPQLTFCKRAAERALAEKGQLDDLARRRRRRRRRDRAPGGASRRPARARSRRSAATRRRSPGDPPAAPRRRARSPGSAGPVRQQPAQLAVRLARGRTAARPSPDPRSSPS